MQEAVRVGIPSVEEPPRRRWLYPRDNEKNYVAAFFHAASALLTMLSLIRLNWFRVLGNVCSPHIGLYHFTYYKSYLRANPEWNFITPHIPSKNFEYYAGSEVLHCITPDIMNLMRVLIILSMVCIVCSMVGFSLDMIGPSKSSLRFVRRHGLPSSWAVLTIITMVGVCYLASNALELAIRDENKNKRFHVSYDYGVYTVTAAGALSLLATACNLLQDPAVQTVDYHTRQRLVEDYDGLETFSVGMRNLPPPPPYTP